ncbi:MAG TPA: hypothetical protein VIU13_09135 [Chryseolinea sp.]
MLFNHSATFDCTSSALFRAPLTVIHIMLPTLLRAKKTYLSTSVAKQGCIFTAYHHELCGGDTNQ